MTKEKYAIIDIGSNTMRLVILQQSKSGRIREIQNLKIAARLRAYLTPDANLSNEGILLLVQSLKTFQDVIDHHQYNLAEIICVATATIRQANNQEEILAAVANETSFNIRILSGYEEAYYGYLAVINSLSLTEGISIDIGGGSTELTYFKDRKLIHYHSFPFGALSLKQEFVSGETPTEQELLTLREYLFQQFNKLSWLKNKDLPIIMIGGSARNIAQINQSQKSYPLAGLHQYKILREEIRQLKNDLFGLSPKELLKVEGLSNDRIDTILPAIEVFDCLSEYVKVPHLILSQKGLRDGLIIEKLKPNIIKAKQVLETSLNELAVDYEIDTQHVEQVTQTVLSLLKELEKTNTLRVKKQEEGLVKKAIFLYNIGQFIDSEASSQHTFYLLANRTIDGLFHKEKIMVALMASYQNKRMFKQYISPFKHWFTKNEKQRIRILGALIKLGYSLHRSKRSIVECIKMEKQDKELGILIGCKQSWKLEEHQAIKEKKHLEKSLKSRVDIQFKAAYTS